MIDDSQVKGLVSREARIEMGPAKLSWEGMMLMWKSSRNPLPNDGGEDYLRCAAVLGHAEHPNVLFLVFFGQFFLCHGKSQEVGEDGGNRIRTGSVAKAKAKSLEGMIGRVRGSYGRKEAGFVNWHR